MTTATQAAARVSAGFERIKAKGFAQVGAIRTAGAEIGDPWNPAIGAPTDTPCTLIELDYTANEIDGSLIQAQDRKVLISTAGVTDAPTQGDQVVIGDRALEIMAVKPLSPGGVVILWEVQARS